MVVSSFVPVLHGHVAFQLTVPVVVSTVAMAGDVGFLPLCERLLAGRWLPAVRAVLTFGLARHARPRGSAERRKPQVVALGRSPKARPSGDSADSGSAGDCGPERQ